MTVTLVGPLPAPGSVVHWNPRVPLLRWGRLTVPGPRRLNNFGDMLGPAIVAKMLERAGLDPTARPRGRRIVAVGSILRLARDGDVVWGAGMNGKSLDEPLNAASLDVRAVRGPRTQQFLAGLAMSAPAVFGDPGLLVGRLWDRAELARGVPHRRVTILPNLRDPRPAGFGPGVRIIDPRRGLRACIGAIAASDLVVGSSLHGVVVAEALGIPARLVTSHAEPRFKYDDYFQGTGRELVSAPTLADAIDQGGAVGPVWDPRPLLDAFPYDLWRD